MDTAQTNLFYRISQYRFMCVELNLYLDTHPHDENARADYQCYARRLLQLIEQYESEYGVKCSKIVYRLCNHMVYSFDILKASQKKRKRWRWLGRKGLWK